MYLRKKKDGNKSEMIFIKYLFEVYCKLQGKKKNDDNILRAMNQWHL